MKKIIISLILFLVCLGGAAASFTFYDAAAYNDWMAQAQAQIEQSAPGLFHKDDKAHHDRQKKHKEEKQKDRNPHDAEDQGAPREQPPHDQPVPSPDHPGPQVPQEQGTPAPHPAPGPDRNAP